MALAAVLVAVDARHDNPEGTEDPAASPPSVAPTPAPTPVSPPPSSQVSVPPPSVVPVVPPAKPAALTPDRRLKPPSEKQQRPQEPQPTTPDRNPVSRGSVTFEPSEVPAMNSKAEKAAGDGDYDRAIQLYQLVLRYQPGNADAQRGLEKARRNKASRDKAAREQDPP